MKPVLLAVASDLHAGSTIGLCPPEIALDDGGTYRASKVQLWLWQCWHDFLARVYQVRSELNAELYFGFNGDLVEGDHHRSTQIVSGNPTAQTAVLNACMKSVLDLHPDHLLFVRGTETHGGPSNYAEERVALGLLKDKRPVIPDPVTGTAAWWHFRGLIDGVRLDIAHHGRTGFREHTRGGAANLHAHDILLAHVKDGDPPPHLCLRAHYHRFNDSYDHCMVRVVTSGCWQLATGHVHKVATDTMADVGGLIVVIQDGRYTVEKVDFKPERGPVWTPASR